MQGFKFLPFSISLIAALAAIFPLVLQGQTTASTVDPTSAPHSSTDQGTPRVDATTAPKWSELLSQLHEINLGEIEVGRLAQKKGTAAEVKAYGKTLEQDHLKADKDVTALAKKQSIDLNTKNAPLEQTKADNKATKERLADLDGKEFDSQFLQAMQDGHSRAIALIKTGKTNLPEAPAQQLFAKLLPTLEKHANHAKELHKEVMPVSNK